MDRPYLYCSKGIFKVILNKTKTNYKLKIRDFGDKIKTIVIGDWLAI